MSSVLVGRSSWLGAGMEGEGWLCLQSCVDLELVYIQGYSKWTWGGLDVSILSGGGMGG